MNDNGWIKISRNITEHWLWDDGEKLKWWLDLLLMAQWEDKKVMYDSHLYTLQRGQMLASISFLTERWKRNRQTVMKFLKLLEEENMITRTVMDRQTPILTICNYDKYQLRVDTQTDKQMDTQMDAQTDRQADTIQEYKEYKESKEENIVVVDAHTHTHARGSALDLRPYHARLEAIAMSCHIKPQELECWIQEFNVHLEAVGETYDDANQYLLRLKNWINKRQEIMRNATNNHSTRNSQPDFSQRVSGAAAVALGFIRECNAGGPQTQSSGGGLSADVLPF
jgi:hypothetical protein